MSPNETPKTDLEPATSTPSTVSPNETVQTVQPEISGEIDVSDGPASRQAYVELLKDESGNWHWCLFSANGRPMCMNIQGFKRRNDAQKSLEACFDILKGKVKIVAAIE